jgi:ATP-dependent protease HslVU (ClpYQ) peptidase subunit
VECIDRGMEFLGWIKWGMGSRGKPGGLSDEFTGLLLDENGLYEYESPLVPIRIEGEFWAIGSGAQAALGAMRMGANPAEAVKIACAIDPFCGEPITVERLSA